ncbi:hypothetical protein DEJ45_04955 [Streptomyces venezuelae]|uniref:hypothetical protein n=1 Tax=Streptomyces venezuelae TaxID=54571 RepID=UPI00123E2045|nr:hypothetical protein [Streptomyces venezuelae]QES11806.1 hypothetical protein DEJ45_04955 [Streptomyces venezuelae]
MRTRLAAALSGVLLAAGTLLNAPAATAQASAYPTSSFDVTVGNTYTRGTITWYNRSVTVTGEHKSVDGFSCRGTSVFTLNSAGVELSRGYSANVCGMSANFTVPVEADVAGGAAVVRICLDDGGMEPDITYYLCKRYGHP